MSELNFGYNPELSDAQIKLALGGMLPQIFGGTYLHGLHGSVTRVNKEQGVEAQPTNQIFANAVSSSVGVPPPVDIIVARSFKDISPHHASCIQSKKNSSIGLGFVSEGDDVEQGKVDPNTSTQEAEEKVISLLTGESFVESKVDKELDSLTLDGFYNDFARAIEDYFDGGTGYLEIIRGEGSRAIIGINWIPYENLRAYVVIDNSGKGRVVYKYTPSLEMGVWAGVGRWYSLFGIANRDWVYEKYYNTASRISKEMVSEIIPFKTPSNMSRWYGYPDWLSASAIITLLALSLQYKSDFYTNRGVLAYILSVAGKIDSGAWKKIEDMVQGSVGGGNNFRNLAIQTDDKDAKVQVDKLASTDKTELQFSKDSEVYAQNIVSAHRVPPVLANILIPGKLGASNETVQALIAFQLLNIGPHQNVIQSTLARTLGGKEGIDGLDPEDFRLRKITSQFNIEGLDTVGRMREEAPAATEDNGSQRDVSSGVKD